jgi:hypothetical protein
MTTEREVIAQKNTEPFILIPELKFKINYRQGAMIRRGYNTQVFEVLNDPGIVIKKSTRSPTQLLTEAIAISRITNQSSVVSQEGVHTLLYAATRAPGVPYSEFVIKKDSEKDKIIKDLGRSIMVAHSCKVVINDVSLNQLVIERYGNQSLISKMVDYSSGAIMPIISKTELFKLLQDAKTLDKGLSLQVVENSFGLMKPGEIIADHLARLLGYTNSSLTDFEGLPFGFRYTLPFDIKGEETSKKEIIKLFNQIKSTTNIKSFEDYINEILFRLNHSFWNRVIIDWRQFSESVTTICPEKSTAVDKVINTAAHFLKKETFDEFELEKMDGEVYAALYLP